MRGFPAVPEAAQTVDAYGVRVSLMALAQRPDPRAPLLLLPSASVAARQAAGDSCRGAVQTALTMYLHQRACCEPLAVRAVSVLQTLCRWRVSCAAGTTLWGLHSRVDTCCCPCGAAPCP